MRASEYHNYYWRAQLRWQRGQVMLFTILLLGLIVSASLHSFIRPSRTNIEVDTQTARALAQAKEALIAYASAQPAIAGYRAGELPCPDTNNNGSEESSCGTPATQIGRLPWAKLGIPDVRDGSGERLWYAVSSNFKNNPVVTPLNSNTPGQLSVTGIAPANNVIAIVFAPGAPVAGQSRTPTNINNVAHYLDGENANGDTIFTSAISSDLFNDKLLAITPAMYFPAVEMRVARQLRSALNTYYDNNRRFPPANAYGSPCIRANQGLIPQDPATCTGNVTDPTLAPPSSWLTVNQWFQTIFYAVAPACVDAAALDCTGAGGFLTVNGVSGIRALIIAPGTPFPGQPRPCVSNTDCLEPPNSTSFPDFTHVTGSATTNDRVVIVAP